LKAIIPAIELKNGIAWQIVNWLQSIAAIAGFLRLNNPDSSKKAKAGPETMEQIFSLRNAEKFRCKKPAFPGIAMLQQSLRYQPVR